jgi:RNA recognition motif-containing protein
VLIVVLVRLTHSRTDNIDDDTIVEFFKDCGELTGTVYIESSMFIIVMCCLALGLRWMTRVGTEEFRGCGFVEFGTSEAADRAVRLDGKELLGR